MGIESGFKEITQFKLKAAFPVLSQPPDQKIRESLRKAWYFILKSGKPFRLLYISDRMAYMLLKCIPASNAVRKISNKALNACLSKVGSGPTERSYVFYSCFRELRDEHTELTIDTTHLTPEEAVQEILLLLSEKGFV